MSLDLEAIKARAEKHANAIGPGGEKAWLAGVLAADVPALIAEVERLTGHSKTLNTIAFKMAEALGDVPHGQDWTEGNPTEQAQRLIAKCDKLWNDCAFADGERDELRAEVERAQPVLDAARAWRRWFPSVDSMFVPENALIAAVDALAAGPGGCAGHTRRPPEVESATKLPVCVDCGHRHRWGGECADHSWSDACPYDAGADCEAAEGLSSTDTTASGVDHG